MADNFNTIEGTEVINVNDAVQGSHAITLDDVKNFIGGGKKVYKALLTQIGTTAPTAVVLENTLGTVTFAYEDVGIYAINSSNLFTNNKTTIFIGNNTNNSGDPMSIYTSWNDASNISLFTFNISLADWKNGSIIRMPILIEVYP